MNSRNERADKLSALYNTLLNELAVMTDINGKIGDFSHPVFGEGDPYSELMLIGEAPGKEEAESSHPFVGKAGHTLDDLLTGAGIIRSEIFLTNAVKYRPMNMRTTTSGKVSYSNRTPTDKEIENALPTLRAELAIVSPKIVVTLGNTPLKAVWAAVCDGKPPVIGQAHGKFYRLENRETGTSFELCPLYHPASAIYNRSLLPIMEDDIARLKENYHKITLKGAV